MQLKGNLHSEMLGVISDLKREMASALIEISQPFIKDCKSIASQYSQGSKPRDAEVYQAALLFMKGQITPDIDYLYSMVSFGLYQPIEAAANQCIASNQRKLEELLERYREEVRTGQLWEMTWLGVLISYFQPTMQFAEHETLLRFLQDTYPRIVGMSEFALPWMKSLDEYPSLLTRDPCRPLAENRLKGEEAQVKQIVANLHIPEESWFWHELTRACIQYATDKPDEIFKSHIPKLLSMIEESPGFIDEDFSAVLQRYYQCKDKPIHEGLKEFALRHWKNPKLRYAPGSKWVYVQEPAWRMVTDWVSEAYSRVIFEKFSSQYGSGASRLAAWLRYISWVKLVSGYPATRMKQKEQELNRLFRAEEALLTCEQHEQGEKLEEFLQLIGAYAGEASSLMKTG